MSTKESMIWWSKERCLITGWRRYPGCRSQHLIIWRPGAVCPVSIHWNKFARGFKYRYLNFLSMTQKPVCVWIAFRWNLWNIFHYWQKNSRSWSLNWLKIWAVMGQQKSKIGHSRTNGEQLVFWNVKTDTKMSPSNRVLFLLF